eukprot:NODE_896_length_1107_cov_104.879017_g732_i0.p1 GENE.NODE_896_length_1107_cov_104.879017_g732_i0~~NODE_896_length_1107_cov_104.879017_g732_i0.p1  ORF type:complete len:127 (+),score=9.71 NODE_896_length_1107_cov_104.879017_g732_i0:30-410(+)
MGVKISKPREEVTHKKQDAKKDAASAVQVAIYEASDPTCATFVFTSGEDHTLGNAVRHVLMQNPGVKLCGYTIPHPLESTLKIHLETAERPAKELFLEAMDSLMNACEEVKRTFQAALEAQPDAPA